MSNVVPNLKKPYLPSLTNLLDVLKREIMKDINCVKIGTIQSFNASTQEATVQIAFTQVTSTSAAGIKTYAEYPVLLNVPVQFPSGGGFTLTFPVHVGDECIVLFNDRQIDNWLTSGTGLPPSIGRLHDLSDGIAIVGVRNNTRALAGVSTTTTQLRDDAGDTYVEIAGGQVVNVVAPTQINLISPAVVITGTLNVENTGSASAPCTINGAIHATEDIVAGVGTSNISLLSHAHTGVTTGSGDTGGPVG